MIQGWMSKSIIIIIEFLNINFKQWYIKLSVICKQMMPDLFSKLILII